MIRINKMVLIIASFFTISCNTSVHNGLKLVILNDTIYSSKLKVTKNRIGNFYKINTINYLLINNSNNTYSILPPKYDGFKSLKLSYGSLLITDKKENVGCVFGGSHCNMVFNSLKDINLLFKDLGYKNKSNLMSSYHKNSFIIHPNEKLYFENILGFPRNKYSNVEYVALDTLKQYYFSLKFSIDTSFYKERLTRASLQTIKENNYKLFHGTIVSENAVPIVFVDE